MSGVRCVWANVPEASERGYEKEHVQDLAAHGADHALHCEVVKLGLEMTDEAANMDSWRWLTVYESKDLKSASEKLQGLTNKILTSPLADLRLDIRTYEEFKCWQAKDWDCDFSEVASVAVMEWSIKAGKEKEVLDFYIAEVGPTISSSPDVLRFRLLKTGDATVLKGSQETLKKEAWHTYLTLVEIACDEWPWDVVVALGENPKWREYFEERKAVDWRSSHYLVNRVLPDVDGNDE